MKILHVIPSISPTLGGPSEVALNIVHALRESGVDTEIVTTNYGGAQPMDVPLNQRVDYTFKAEREVSVPVWFLPYTPPSLKEFIFSWPLTNWLWENIQNYQLLDNHYLFSYAPSCAATVARLKGIPYTVRTMGQLTPWALAQKQLKKQVYTLLVERHNLNHAAAIHCTTSAEAENVRKFGIQKPTITLPLGANSPMPISDAAAQLRHKYSIPADTPIVLFLSRLHYKKRPELLLQSLSQLKNQGHCFHAIFAGSGESDYIGELQDLVSSLSLAQQVSFPGLVTGFDKDLLLQGADLFVLPSFSENFGIAVAEALVAGLPVVITPEIQISSDVVAAEAGLVMPGEVESFTGAISQLLSTPKLRQELGANAQRLAQTRYSWKPIAQSLASTYEAIISGSPLPQDTQFDDSAIAPALNLTSSLA